MTQKTLRIMAALSLVLFLSGCSQKAPDLEVAESGKNNISDANKIEKETVTIDESTYGKKSTSNIENTGKYNSSTGGFQSIYFGFGNYDISIDMENNIVQNSTSIKNLGSRIKIEGNCDEFGTDEYNYALGLKRAKAVKDSIVSQGVSAKKIVIISYGESNPVCSSPTDECYAQNRRVDLHIVK